MKKQILLLLGSALCLSACATTSFAPPSVNFENEMMAQGSNRRFSQNCTPVERTVANAGATRIAIQQDVDGARALINNFIFMYRCTAHRAANGRQAFEVPSFLALTGAAAAAAFGAGPDVAIAGGAANAVLNGGKSYYAPQQKAEIFDHALDALLCIKTEAVGIDALEIAQLERTEEQLAKGLGVMRGLGDDELSVSPSKQYFDLVSAALLSVERVLAQRLSNVGTFDAAGVVAQIEGLNKEIEKEEQGGEPADGGGTGGTPPPATGNAATQGALTSPLVEQLSRQLGTTARSLQATKIDLNTLRPKLEKCVVRAKI